MRGSLPRGAVTPILRATGRAKVLRNMAVQSAEAYVGELNLAAGQLTMVGLISANEGVEQNELARVMLMRKSQVTTLIQDLVSRGFVTREEHGADGITRILYRYRAEIHRNNIKSCIRRSLENS